MQVKGRKQSARNVAKTTKTKAKAPAAEAQAPAQEHERPSTKAMQTLLGHTTVDARTAQAANTAQGIRPWQMQTDVSIVADSHKVAALLPKMLCDLGGVTSLSELGVRPLVASAGKDSLFNALFGRDSIRMSFDLIDSYPAVAKSTIKALAKLQGVKVNPKSEEEPGRIIHENRDPAELARIREFEPGIDKWEFPYYGAIDSTPTFVNLIGEYVKRHGPSILDETVNESGKTVREAVTAAVGWVEGRLDDKRAGGFLWVQRANPHGIENQILEDSYDSVYDEHGKRPEGAYAPVAEQGYAYKALMTASALLGKPELAARAEDLKERFIAKFWQDDLGTFAQAVAFDAKGEGRAFRTVASSPGQLLTSGMLDDQPELRDRMIDRLFSPDMLAGPGIRTKSTTAARFLEGGYHNGTVWPTISLEIKDGLLRSAEHVRHQANEARAKGDIDGATKLSAKSEELFARAVDLEDRAIRATAKFPYFPEFFRGSVDGKIRVNEEVVRKEVDGRMNTLEQPPQPQGWTATAMERILRRRGFIEDVSAAAE
jgi:glycogen debranching enzyme